jgi:hypothetical protein
MRPPVRSLMSVRIEMSREKCVPHLVAADDDGNIIVETEGPIDADMARVLARFARVRWAKQGQSEPWQTDGHGGRKLVIRALLYDPVPHREGGERFWYCPLTFNDVNYTLVVEMPEDTSPAAASRLVGDLWANILVYCDEFDQPWLYDKERYSGWLLSKRLTQKEGK